MHEVFDAELHTCDCKWTPPKTLDRPPPPMQVMFQPIKELSVCYGVGGSSMAIDP